MKLVTCMMLVLAACSRGEPPKASSPNANETRAMDDLDMTYMATLLGPSMQPESRGLTPFDNAARIIQEFSAARPLDSTAISGSSVWFGEGFTVHPDGSDAASYMTLYVRARDGGIEGALESLEPENFEESSAAATLAAALRAGSPVPGENRVRTFLESAKPKAKFQSFARTTGASMTLAGDRVAFLRLAGSRMLVIERAPAGSTNRRTPLEGAGRYSELWPVP